MKAKNPRDMLKDYCEEEVVWEEKLRRNREDALTCFRIAVAPILKRMGMLEARDRVFVSPTEHIGRLPRDSSDRSFVTHLPEMYIVRGDGRVECVEHVDREYDLSGSCVAWCTEPVGYPSQEGDDVPSRVLAALLERLEKGEFIFETPKVLVRAVGPSI